MTLSVHGVEEYDRPGKLPTRCTVRKLGTQTTQRRKYARYCRNVDEVTGRNKAWLQLPPMIRHTWYEPCRERETDLSPVPPLSSSPISKRRQQLSKGGLNLELEEKRAKMPISARKQRGKNIFRKQPVTDTTQDIV